MIKGWECPKCGKVWSPFTIGCRNCNVEPRVQNVQHQCTCGTSAKCPLHP